MVKDTLTKAEAPFDDKDQADVVLRTSDQVDFYVYKNILSLASPFFQSMFSLQQPLQSMTDPAGLPVVEIPEASDVTDCMLRICYPIYDPTLTDLQFIDDCLGVAQKYEFVQAIAVLSKALRRFRKSEPLRVFAIAYRWKLEYVVKAAAEIWSKKRGEEVSYPDVETNRDFSETDSGASFIQALAGIPAAAFFRLLKYLRTGADVAFCESPALAIHPTPASSPEPIVWLRHPGADAIIQSSDGLEFYAHSFVLSLSSAVLADQIKAAVPDGSEGLPTILLAESGRMASILLQLCYPAGEPSIPQLSLAETHDVFDCALKYKLSYAKTFLDRRLKQHLPRDALSVYLTASRNGLEQTARAAATQLVHTNDAQLYTRELETTPTLYYHALLKFIHEYRKILTEMCFSTAPSAHAYWTQVSRSRTARGTNPPRIEHAEEVFSFFLGQCYPKLTRDLVALEKVGYPAARLQVQAKLDKLRLDFTPDLGGST